jgi:Holliday junction DNA helicase RuvA
VIGSLRGQLLDKDSSGEAMIEVQGMGYRVAVSASTLASLPSTGAEAFLHVHHHIREDHQQLYGFPSVEERRCFETLISAHGVGPTLAMAILSALPQADLRHAVATDDVDALCVVPGVGKKTAARLVLELKNKLDVPDLGIDPQTHGGTPGASSVVGDVRDALAGMGFSGDEIKHALTDVGESDDVSQLLREALRRLAAR